MIKDSINLFKELPGSLCLVWAGLLIGLILSGAGYFGEDTTLSAIGAVLLVGGYVAAAVDLWIRKKKRNEAAPFYTGLVVAPVVGSFMFVLIALLAALVLIFISVTRGYSEGNFLRMVHFLVLVFAFLVICGIPRLAMAALRDSKATTKTEQDGADQPATTDESGAE